MQYFDIIGGKKLKGSISVNGSKNAAVALLAASVINQDVTVLKNVPQIEEVNRWIEVLTSIGMHVEKNDATLTLTPAKKITPDTIDIQAAERTDQNDHFSLCFYLLQPR